jgi:CRISPR system Cascade subunit CasB
VSTATSKTSAATNAIPEPSLGSLIARIARVIGEDRFPNGERASLKRLAAHESPGLTFFRFWPRYVGADAPPDAQVADWAAILFGIALMGRNAHAPHRRLGAALADSQYSEGRLERLLAADDQDTRRVLFVRTVRFLAAKGESCNWVEAAAWLLSSDEKRDAAARRIARDYYATQTRLDHETKE